MNCFEMFVNMVEEATEKESRIYVLNEGKNTTSVFTFVPYEYNLENKIYIEGESCKFEIEDIENIEMSYDEIEGEFVINVKGDIINIGCITN